MQIGFIGTGTMGTPIAGCLIDAGHALTVYDIRSEATRTLAGRGAEAVASPRAVAEKSEVVFTSLPGPDEMRATVLDPQRGVLAGLREGGCYIDLTTNAPAVAREVAAACARQGRFDARCAGQRPAARHDGHGRRRRGCLCPPSAAIRGHRPQHLLCW